MSKLKGTLIGTVALVIGAGSYFLFTYDFDDHATEAALLFEEGKTAAAGTALQQAHKHLTPAIYHLYQSYIERAAGQLAASDDHLSHAVASAIEGLPEDKPSDKVLGEIYLNQALNAYLQGDEKGLTAALDKAQPLLPREPLITAFRGLNQFILKDYAGAWTLWNQQPRTSTLSSWMKKSFDTLFSPAWQRLVHARCLIEAGKVMQARALLTDRDPQIAADQRALLLALSYAKEAEEKPLEGCSAYYKLSHSYLAQAHPNTVGPISYADVSASVTHSLQTAALSEMTRGYYNNLPFFAELFLDSPQAFNALQIALEAKLRVDIISAKQGQPGAAALAINTHLPAGQLRQAISNYLEASLLTHLDAALDQGHFNYISSLLASASLFIDHATLLTEQVTTRVGLKVSTIALRDNPSLTATEPLLTFWNSLEGRREARAQMASELAALAAQALTQSEGETKALALLKAAKEIAYYSDKEMLCGAVLEAMELAHTAACEQDSLSRLTAVYDGLALFELTEPESWADGANQLEDARYLMTQNNYTRAEQKASWALRFTPVTEESMRLIGLCQYHQGRYREAIETLTQLVHPPENALEIIALCHISSGDLSVGREQLTTLAHHLPLSDQGYLLLGYSALLADDPKDAVRWLDCVRHPDDQAHALLLVGSYQKGDYFNCWRAFERLSPPYNQVHSLQAMAVESLVYAGEAVAAQKILAEARTQPEPERSHLPKLMGEILTNLGIVPDFEALSKSIDVMNTKFKTQSAELNNQTTSDRIDQSVE